jgi:RHS repeat-associated protein
MPSLLSFSRRFRYHGTVKNKVGLGILLALTLITSSVFASMVENSRQGYSPTISVFASSEDPAETALPPGDSDIFTLNLWQGSDTHHWGRHFGSAISPYLFASRKWDGFSKTYNNRNRYYNPRVGRFTSVDPLRFFGGNNLWAYPQNPVIFRDPFGLFWIKNWLGFCYTRGAVTGGIGGTVRGVTGFAWIQVTLWDYFVYQKIWVPEPPCFEIYPTQAGIAPQFSIQLDDYAPFAYPPAASPFPTSDHAWRYPGHTVHSIP